MTNTICLSTFADYRQFLIIKEHYTLGISFIIMKRTTFWRSDLPYVFFLWPQFSDLTKTDSYTFR